MTFKKTLPLWRGLITLFASLLVIFIGAALVFEANRGFIDEATGAQSEEIVRPDADPDVDLYGFKSSYNTSEEMVKANVAFSEKVEENGAVLLKNDLVDGETTLPLATEENMVSLVGKAAYSPVYGGQMGSGSAANSNFAGYERVSLESALTEEEFSINPDLQEAYTNQSTWSIPRGGTTPEETIGPRSVSTLGGSFGMTSKENWEAQGWSYDINEVTLAELEAKSAGCTEDFGDYRTSIVVLGRINSEGRDYLPGEQGVKFESDGLDPNTGNNGFSRNAGAKDPLGLTDDERAMIAMAKENSDKVIVLINSNSMMEVPELVEEGGDYEADAVLWIGTPSTYGFRGVVDILTGEVNPSGKLPDTYVADNSASPAAQNWDIFTYTNPEEIGTEGNGQSSVTNGVELDAETMRASAYTVYAEGIYVGYKYYETRYADTYLDPDSGASSAAGAKEGATSWVYDDEVVWPFGYGLSYTTFEQTLQSVTWDFDAKTITATVSVENTGDLTGKEAVQLYVSLPYDDTDVAHGVEKAAIQLVDFGKVEVASGDTEEITITTDLQNIGSYDSMALDGEGTYILGAGDYYFTVGNGAHEAMQNVLQARGQNVGGNADNVKTLSLGDRDEDTLSESKNGTEIRNQLDNADLNYYIDDAVTYLTRSDWDGTFPEPYTGLEATDEMITELRNIKYQVKDEGRVTEQWGVDSGLTLADMKGLPFEDGRWEIFLNQIELEEAVQIIAQGGNTTWMLDSIQNPAAKQADGPAGFTSISLGGFKRDADDPYYTEEGDDFYGFAFNTTPNAPILAASFDKALLNEWGVMLGDESLWTGGPSIWAGGANQHRAPYEGRTHEYFSEDAMLSNLCLVEQCKGALTKGCLVGPKHFAFNAIEYNRYGLSEFMTEQAAREGDLRCFQGAFESGYCLAGMTAFNRIGASYINGHIGLMQNILRGEWGFKGLLTTDMVNNQYLMVLGDTIMGGITMMANGSGVNDPDSSHTAPGAYWEYCSAENIESDPEIQAQLKENMHYQWYAYAQSNLLNGLGSGVNFEVRWLMTWYRALYIAGIVASAVLAVAAVGMYVFATVKNRKEEA